MSIQDCILKYEVNIDPEESKTILELTGVPDYLENYKGIKRISHMEGIWIITGKGNNQSDIEYYIFSNQAPQFPTWITDPIIQKNMLRSMNVLRRVITEDKHKTS